MWKWGRLFCIVFGLIFCFGCVKRVMLPYGEVEKTNRVKITLNSGQKIKGTILKAEPHQLTLYMGKNRTQTISKSNIEMIQRYSPVYDDFGRGISEEEIQHHQKKRHTTIYGIGGGTLCFGTSFFIGSILGQSMSDGKNVLIGTTTCGGLLGTILFTKAGKNKDRQIAIEAIKEKRKMAEVNKNKQKSSKTEMKSQLESEKKRQEELREEHEKLLKELQNKQSDE